MKKRVLLSVFIAVTSVSFSQTALRKQADVCFEKQDYIEAATAYERIVQKGDSSIDVILNLADAYYFNANYLKANRWYEKGFTINHAFSANHFHRYFQTLKSSGKIDKAANVLAAFSKLYPTDLRVKNFNNSTSYFKNPLSVTIQNLALNSAYSDYGASIFKDSLVFSSARPALVSSTEYYRTAQPFTNLFYATKSDSTYTNVSLLKKEVTYSAFHEASPVFTKDGKTMYYTKNELKNNKKTKAKDGLYKLYKAVFENGKWVDKGMMQIFGTEGARIAHPALSLDEKTLYFAADMKQGFGQSDIYSITLNADGSIGLPVNLGPKINSEGRESYPFVTENNVLIFASDGHPGFGGFDLFAVDLLSPTAPIINLGNAINSTEDDFNYVQKAGTNEGVFSSNRIGGKGDDDIYGFKILNNILPEKQIMLAGIVKDSLLLTELDGVIVLLKDKNNQVIATTTTDSKGNYQFPVIKGTNYTLEFKKENYSTQNSLIEVSKNQEENLKLDANLGKNSADFALMCTINDARTKASLSDVLIVMHEVNSNKLFITDKTNANGSIYKDLPTAKINDKLAVQITLSKPGYFTKVIQYNKIIESPGIIRVHEELDLSLEPIDKGMDLAKVFEIKPIYFDLNKFAIRPDAAAELDKIVAILNENPSLEIELGSHTDCRSSAVYNEWLSDERAKASAAYIKARITNPERITGKGYGESQLLNDCGCEGTVKSNCKEAQHQLNRRTEFKIVGFNGIKNPLSKPSIISKPIAVSNLIKKPAKEIKTTTSINKNGVVHSVNPLKPNTASDSIKKSLKLAYPEGFVLGADLSKVLQIPMIYFDLDKYNIRPDAAIELDKIVAVMNVHPTLEVEIGSHTDCRASFAYNERLSDLRAKASAAYIRTRITNPKRIYGKGYGETKLVSNCPCEGKVKSTCSEDEHQLNRRTEFKIIKL